ncbi:MAG: pseudouridine-5'-phosphate glycosidase [Kiritimatiellia bacterium]
MKLHFSNEVAASREKHKPLLALESTLITHGLPYPENAAAGDRLESAAREEGVTPATIALLDGQARVGLTAAELHSLAAMQGVRKCSLRDLPVAMARGENGGTTVAATMHLAHAAGIPVFSTGGIGGVHRGHPFDVSADLTALGSIPVTVVCAGAKAILDLPLTLEVLETQGVTVVGYRSDEFPAFYYRASGLPVDVRCDTAEEIAGIIRARDEAGLRSAILVVNPVPEAEAMPRDEAEAAIEQALAEAASAGISGKQVTPFLLAKVSALTEAKSMKANLALLENNVRLGAAIAREL